MVMSWIEGRKFMPQRRPLRGGKYLLWLRASKQKRGLKIFDTTLEFAQKRVFVCRRRTAIIDVHWKRVATTCCPGPWFV